MKQIPLEDKPAGNRTQLGMPPVIPITTDTHPENKPEKVKVEESHDRFTFNELDFAKLDTTLDTTSSDPHYGTISDDEKTQPGYLNPRETAAEKATLPLTISTPPAPLPTPKPRPTKRLVFVLVGVLTVGLIAAAVFFFLGKSTPAPRTAPPPAPPLAIVKAPPPPPKSAPIAAPTPAPAPAPAPATLPEAETVSEGDTVRITLTGRLNRAQVLMNGTPVETTFTVPRSDKPMKVEVSRPGYETTVKRIVPGQDKAVFISMKKVGAQ